MRKWLAGLASLALVSGLSLFASPSALAGYGCPGSTGFAVKLETSGYEGETVTWQFDTNCTRLNVIEINGGSVSDGTTTWTTTNSQITTQFRDMADDTSELVFTVGTGDIDVRIYNTDRTSNIRALITSDGPAPEPDPGTGGGSQSSAPMLDLTLDPTETDATCSVARVSGPRGSWVTLEAASDCTPPPSTPDATLLGWATNPDFPLDIAQRQVDNSWGAYETYNDDGQLTGVFIPAGGAAQLTNTNTLYAIWSDTSTDS